MELVSQFSRFFVGMVFLAAGVAKLGQGEEFERAVENYELLPRWLVPPVASWLPRLEIGGGLALVFGVALVPAATLVALMLLVFVVAVAVNLLRGREMSCNCFGSASPEKMTWLTVGRNVVLTGMAMVVVLVPPVSLAIWPGPLAVSGATAGAGVALAMLCAAVSAVVLAGIVGAAWRVFRDGKRLEERLYREELGA